MCLFFLAILLCLFDAQASGLPPRTNELLGSTSSFVMFENSEKPVYHHSVTTLFNYRKQFHPCSILFSVGMDRTECKIRTAKFAIDHYCSRWLRIIDEEMWCDSTDDVNSRQWGREGIDRRSWLYTYSICFNSGPYNEHILYRSHDISTSHELVDLLSVFFLTAKDELNQRRIGDMRLFDFSWQQHVRKQMAKCIAGLEGDTNIRKEEWNEQEIQKHRKAEWVSDVEHSLLYDPGHEHWVTDVHGTYTVSWCCVHNAGRLPSTWKGRLPPSFCAVEQRFLVLLASSLHGR